MLIKKNTPELWSNIWKEVSIEEDLFNLKREENSIRWQRIESIILLEFSSFRNLKVIEL